MLYPSLWYEDMRTLNPLQVIMSTHEMTHYGIPPAYAHSKVRLYADFSYDYTTYRIQSAHSLIRKYITIINYGSCYGDNREVTQK